MRDYIAQYGGFEVKTIGDAFIIAFGRARRALLCAIDIQHGVSRYSAEHPEHPVRVRIGLHTGEPVREGNDFHGKSMIFASRIAAEASGGEILVSALLLDLTETAGHIRFEAGREVALKGLEGTHRVYPVLRDTRGAVSCDKTTPFRFPLNRPNRTLSSIFPRTRSATFVHLTRSPRAWNVPPRALAA